MKILLSIIMFALFFLSGCDNRSDNTQIEGVEGSEAQNKKMICKRSSSYSRAFVKNTPNNTPETYVDYPHDDGLLMCFECHDFSNGQDKFIITDYDTPSVDIDDTAFNRLCQSCHNGTDGPYVQTHSSINLDNDYGDWNIECKTCHWPHEQKQYKAYGSESYLAQGDSENIVGNVLTDSDANWTVDEWTDYILYPKADENDNTKEAHFRIRSNTATTLTLHRDINTPTEASIGDNYAIIYGKLIQDIIETPNSGPRDVKFFRQIGINAYADGDGNIDGICEVCHTQTKHHRNNDDNLSIDRTHNITVSCTVCHKHKYGFKPIPGGGHETHLQADYGPQISCNNSTYGCHGTNIPGSQATILFEDGLDLNNTNRCNICHGEGVAKAKQYWQTPGSSIDTNNSWRAIEGEVSFCGSCHNETPDSNVSGAIAPNIIGDNITYGFFINGHGKTDGNYTKLSWQDSTANGNPAANKVCSNCHDYTKNHIDSNGSKRLKDGFENDAGSTVCQQCHTTGGVADAAPVWFSNYNDFNNSAHGASKGANLKCTVCHDVHGVVNPRGGTIGTSAAMTKALKEALCFKCHSSTGSLMQVVNEDISNNRTDGHVSSNYIQDSFAKSTHHDLGTSFSVGGKTYTLNCISCHNVHIVTGKYWDAEENKTPITRFPGNIAGFPATDPWGDEPDEKMDYYAKNSGSGSGGWAYSTARGDPGSVQANPAEGGRIIQNAGGTYQPLKDGNGTNKYKEFEFSGADLPAYPVFCLDCHSSDMGGNTLGAVNWNDPHGLGVAGTPYNMNDQDPLVSSFWGSNGNPDPIFYMKYATRGRGTGHFNRWPFDAADRASNINYILSCTDCHEPHGSNQGSMIRERFQNANHGDGSIWNNFCNACHYYYGGHHAGMSCGNASCHEQNSIHRMKKNNISGSTPRLRLTSPGYALSYTKPDFTPNISWATGVPNSTRIVVNYDMGVYGNQDLNESISENVFWIFNSSGIEIPDSIASVSHTAGDSRVTVTLKNSISLANIIDYTIATKPKSVWVHYAGGYDNLQGNGLLAAQAVPAGPWPEDIVEAPALVQGALYGALELRLDEQVIDSDVMYITFNDSVYANSDASGDLQISDFVISCGGRTISSLVHTAGDKYVKLVLSTTINQSEIGGSCTAAAAPNAIYDVYGTASVTDALTLSLPPIASADSLVINWNFNESNATTQVQNTDALGTEKDLHGDLILNVKRVTNNTKPGAKVGDNAILMDGGPNDKGSVQMNYTINPNDGYPPATYNGGGAPVIVSELEATNEFSFSVWVKPTALGCQEGQDLGLNAKLRRDIMSTQFWIKNWALGIMRFSDDGNPIDGNCNPTGLNENETHDVLRFWVSVNDPSDLRCDPWGGSMGEAILPVNPAGYYQGGWITGSCGDASYPMPTNSWTHAYAQTETLASGAPTYGGVALKTDVWQLISGTWDGRYIRIYIDGDLAAQTDMGGTGNYAMLADPHLWDNVIGRHVSSYFSVGVRAKWSSSVGSTFWDNNGFYDTNTANFVGEMDDVKYWKIALPLSTVDY